MVSFVLSSGSAAAGIVALAPNGAGAPQVSVSSGVPRIDIVTPDSQGVSFNRFETFDVGREGAILNNARENVNSQLAGEVGGNAALLGGTASVIVNEIVSDAPSYWRGMLEVAGDRADVIIANPSGLVCDGCGFINVKHATFSAGAPKWRDGAFMGIDVARGDVRIESGGMNAKGADYTTILMRAGQVIGQIQANNLSLMASGPSLSPQEVGYALDVAHLGGMYADSIRMMVNRDGVGVRNSGHLQAKDSLVLTSDGALRNAGVMVSQDIALRVASADNEGGTIDAKRLLDAKSDGRIENGGGHFLGRQRLSIESGSL